MSPKLSDARFEIINTFPKNLSQNKKLSADMRLGNFSPRNDILKQFGLSNEQLATPTVFYDKKFSLVERKVHNIVFSKTGISTTLMDDQEENQIDKVNHIDFKPRVRVRKVATIQ